MPTASALSYPTAREKAERSPTDAARPARRCHGLRVPREHRTVPVVDGRPVEAAGAAERRGVAAAWDLLARLGYEGAVSLLARCTWCRRRSDRSEPEDPASAAAGWRAPIDLRRGAGRFVPGRRVRWCAEMLGRLAPILGMRVMVLPVGHPRLPKHGDGAAFTVKISDGSAHAGIRSSPRRPGMPGIRRRRPRRREART